MDIHRLLTGVKPEKLVLLDDYNWPWLPRLRDLDQSSIPDVICKALKKIKPLKKRLQCTASVFAWLIPLQDIHKWCIYRVLEPKTPQNVATLVAQLASSLQQLNYKCIKVPHKWVLPDSVVYCYMLIDSLRKRFVEQAVVYLALCTTRPLLALHFSSDHIQVAAHAAFLSALGDDIYLGQTSPGPLEGIFQQAVFVSDLKKLAAEPTATELCTAGHETPQVQVTGASLSEQHPSVQGATGSTEAGIDPQQVLHCSANLIQDCASLYAKSLWPDVHQTNAHEEYLSPYDPYWNLMRSDHIQVADHAPILSALGDDIYLGQTSPGPLEGIFQQAVFVNDFKKPAAEHTATELWTAGHEAPQVQVTGPSQIEQHPSVQGATGSTEAGIDPQQALHCSANLSQGSASLYAKSVWTDVHQTNVHEEYLSPYDPDWNLMRGELNHNSQTSGADWSSSGKTTVRHPEEPSCLHACYACAELFPGAPHMLCSDLLCPYCGLRFPEMTTFQEHLLLHTRE